MTQAGMPRPMIDAVSQNYSIFESDESGNHLPERARVLLGAQTPPETLFSANALQPTPTNLGVVEVVVVALSCTQDCPCCTQAKACVAAPAGPAGQEQRDPNGQRYISDTFDEASRSEQPDPNPDHHDDRP